jgi:hypothetical protein
VVRSNGSSAGLMPRLVAKLMYDAGRGHGKDWDNLARVVAEDYARQPAESQSS